MLLRRCSGVFVFALLAIAVRASAEDRDLEFIHALESRNYGDTAVEFLESAKDNPAVKDVWDLEMSKSLRIEAMTASDISIKEPLLKQAQIHLDKFAQDKPNHPEALQAKLANAGMVMDQGAEALVLARLAKEPADKKAKFAEARKYFEQAQPILDSAAKSLKDRLAKLGSPSRVQNLTKADRDKIAERNSVEEDLIQARGRLSLIDYYIAQTYTAKEEDGKRRQALNKGAAALDEIYQDYRGDDPNQPTGRFAIAAHSWTGKVDEELGALEDAKAIYDEVLENFQDLKEGRASVFPMEAGPKGPAHYQKTEIDDILARTKHFSLLLLGKRPSQEKEYLAEARDFVENEEYKKNLKNEWGYQAAAFELAKHLVGAADKESKSVEKSKITREALKIISDLAAMRGEFQREAIELRNSLGTSGADNVTNVDEALQDADIAIDKKQWDDATKWLKKAQELEEAKPKRDPAIISTIQERLAGIAMQPVSTDFEETKKKGDLTKEKWSAWLDGVNQVVRDFKKTLTAQKAMGFGIDCAEQLHRIAVDSEREATVKNDKKASQAAAAERAAALKRLNETVELALASYPGSSEADKGKMALARINAMDGKYNEALNVFESIPRTSDKYAEALDMAGRIRYTRFLLERNKPEKDRNANQMEEDRVKATEHFTESTAAAKRALKPGDPFPEGLLKTYLILAQIRLDSKEFKEARDAVEPIVAVLSQAAKEEAKNGPVQLDKNMLDLFGAAVRADVGLNDFQKAGDLGGLLLEIGPDDPQINAVLVSFVQRLDVERKSIQDTLNSLPDSTPPAEAERIRNNLLSVKDMLADMLKKLAARQKMTPPTLVYIGNLFDAIDLPNEAEQQYRSVLERAKDDPDFTKDKENARLVNAVRAKQVSILRKRGKYQEAVDVATNLINQFPNALEPLVERARIYQDWAVTRDPSKFDDAIASWTEIRRRLDKTMARPEPKNPAERASYRGLQTSYFEAIYNTASCLLAQAKRLQSTDKAAAAQKAKLGEQVLTAVLQSHPKLDGTNATQKKFAAIKAQLAAFRSPAMTAATPAG
jgi:hypothetical protein